MGSTNNGHRDTIRRLAIYLIGVAIGLVILGMFRSGRPGSPTENERDARPKEVSPSSPASSPEGPR